MGSEWVVLGCGVVSFMVGYFLYRRSMKVRASTKTLTVEEAVEAAIAAPPKPPSKPVPKGKDGKPMTSNFQGYTWSWRVGSLTDDGLYVPDYEDAGDDIILKIFLQEIRDDQKKQAAVTRDLLKEVTGELKSLNKYMRQLYGPE